MKKEHEDQIIRIAQDTWDYIGSDALHLMEEQGETPVLKRGDVAEWVMDYMYEHLAKFPEAEAEYKKLDFKRKKKLLLKAFPAKTYGW